MSNVKNYRTEVRCDYDYDGIPNVATFAIDEATAKKIIKVSNLVKENDIYKVEIFDYRTSFKLTNDGEDNAVDELSEGKNVRKETDRLHVSKDEFWFSAYIKDTNVEILTERQQIKDLEMYFGLVSEAESGVKYFIGKLYERNGEFEYIHTRRFMTNGDPYKYLDDIASRFYDEEGGDEDDGGYSFNDGRIIVTPGDCLEITKDFYIKCYEFSAITGA